MKPDTLRRIGLAAAVVVIAASIVALEQPWRTKSSVPSAPADLPPELKKLPGGADFQSATGWINTPAGQPVDLVSLRGQVVLVDFWTYSCINCIRTLPYVRAWYGLYHDDGLEIVGVHTPEFRFERDADNVRDAARRYNLTYPIALDNDAGIWTAYHNHYWPAKYLIDAYGKIRYTHFGEGGYDETEAKIRELLVESGHALGNETSNVFSGASSGAAGVTPELYAASHGGSRQSAIGNREGYRAGENITYARPDAIDRDRIYLVGSWHDADDTVDARDGEASVVVRFAGGGGNFVADGPQGACIQVLLDGQLIGHDRAGADVTYTENGPCITLDGPRSYLFYGGPDEEHVVELKAPSGFRLYTFDFSLNETT